MMSMVMTDDQQNNIHTTYNTYIDSLSVTVISNIHIVGTCTIAKIVRPGVKSPGPGLQVSLETALWKIKQEVKKMKSG